MNLCRLGSYRLGSIRIFPPAFQTASLQANSQTYKCLYSIWCFSRQWGFVWSHHWGEVIYLCKWFKPIGPRVLSFVLSNLWVHIIVTLHKSWWHFGICSKHFSFLNSPFESDFYHRLLYTIKGKASAEVARNNSKFPGFKSFGAPRAQKVPEKQPACASWTEARRCSSWSSQ